MASSLAKKVCVKCPKGPGQVICGGCEQWFCLKHLNEHRQDLNQQMDALTLEHDQLRQHLTNQTHCPTHPLIERVDRWETKSIDRIKQVADDVRAQLRDLLPRQKRTILKSLADITKQLAENRESETYTELDLNKWMDQLKQLEEQTNKPLMLEIRNDEESMSLTHLPLIRLQTREAKKGKLAMCMEKCLMTYRLSLTTDLMIAPSVQFPRTSRIGRVGWRMVERWLVVMSTVMD